MEEDCPGLHPPTGYSSFRHKSFASALQENRLHPRFRCRGIPTWGVSGCGGLPGFLAPCRPRCHSTLLPGAVTGVTRHKPSAGGMAPGRSRRQRRASCPGRARSAAIAVPPLPAWILSLGLRRRNNQQPRPLFLHGLEMSHLALCQGSVCFKKQARGTLVMPAQKRL